MNSITLLTPSIVKYAGLHYSYDQLIDPEIQIRQDLADSKVSVDFVKSKILMLDFRGEGQCDLLIDPLTTCIKKIFDQSPVVVFNSIVTNKQLDYEYFCMPAWMTRHCNWFLANYQQLDQSVNTKFLCLMRRPSESRAQLASQLYHRISSLKLSFGSMCESFELGLYKNLFGNCHLPLTLDGPVDQYQQHNSAQDLFSTCLFNIVTETSSQSGQNSWHSLFITEKTFKAFALKQIPLWWAVPGLVHEVRKLGFDLFDDIVCHDYDNTVDENARLNILMQQIDQLDQRYSLNQCNDLRKKLILRFEHNFNIVQTLCAQQNTLFDQITDSVMIRAKKLI